MKEACPHCGSKDGLFICSFGGVNCADCGTFVRMATPEERNKRREGLAKILATNK
jgi:rRNA maturation protein Nop10